VLKWTEPATAKSRYKSCVNNEGAGKRVFKISALNATFDFGYDFKLAIPTKYRS